MRSTYTKYDAISNYESQNPKLSLSHLPDLLQLKSKEPVPDMPKAKGKTPAGEMSQSILITKEKSLIVSYKHQKPKQLKQWIISSYIII